jgi:hypothetical protein
VEKEQKSRRQKCRKGSRIRGAEGSSEMLQIQRIQKRVQGFKREGFEGARIQVKYTFCHREAEWNEAAAISLFNAKKERLL